MQKRILPVFISLFLFFQIQILSQPFSLLRDINRGIRERQPVSLTESNGELLFIVRNTWLMGNFSDFGNELWKSDGTDAGTVQLKVLTGLTSLTSVNGIVYFINIYTGADDELWKSDGTEAGTVKVKSLPARPYFTLTNVNGIVYFVLRDGELWKSDGTEAGTVIVKNIEAGVSNLINVNGTLFFSTNSGSPLRNKLWKSDGTDLGTVIVKEFPGSEPSDLASFFEGNGVLYFTADDGINGKELWRSDGSEAGTTMIKDIEPGSGTSYVSNFVWSKSIIYFFAYNTPNGYALWRTDGTATGTTMVKDLGHDLPPNGLIEVNGTLFFSAFDDANGKELWCSDGTITGTKLLKDINVGAKGSDPMRLINSNGILYFIADDGINGHELWKSDGTPIGTVLVKDIYSGIRGSGFSASANRGLGGGSLYEPFATVNGLLFFPATNGLNGTELWKSNGTAVGTAMVKDISFPTPGSDPDGFALIDGHVYFNAYEAYGSPGTFYANEPFKTDGTLSETVMIGDFNRYGGSAPRHFNGFKEFIYFTANNSDDGHELWKSDGTSAGTAMVKDINPSQGSFDQRGSNPSHFTPVNANLFFSANDGTNGTELWKTDGTEAGTVLVKNINAAGNSDPANLVNLNGTLYFTADDGVNGSELWKSDGTDGGTVMIKNISTGSNSSAPAFLTVVNGVLYFAASDGVNGVELWKSNGTSAGTVLVRNIHAGITGSNPSSLTNINGILYFAADNGTGGRELWKSDGTAAGTMLVKDIWPGINGSEPASLTNINGIIYFSATNAINGREIWRSDGTAAGTVLLKDINTAGSSNPSVFTKVGNNLLFAADDGTHGSEVWFSNGTTAGTRMMQDIEPGSTGSDPTEMIEANGKILVSAFTSYFGREVWVASAPADAPVLLATISPAGPLTACSSSVVLKANTGAGYTYQWRKGTANISGATASSYTATVSGAYSFLVKDALGNTAVSDVVIVTISTNPPAIITAAGPLAFCSGKSVLLRANTGAGFTYQWKKGTANIQGANQYSYMANASGVYSVVVTNASGCSAISPVATVVVNPTPVANITAVGPLTVCTGKTVLLRATIGAGYTYQWKKGTTILTGATASSYTASSTGSYSVTVTNATGCFVTSPATTVVVNPVPLATVTTIGSLVFCAGKSVLFRANTGSGYTYQWKKGNVNIAGANQYSYTATTSGVYTVVVTNASGCSTTSAGKTVVANPLPVSTISAIGPLTFCSGKSVLLRAYLAAGYTYQWKKGNVVIPGATLYSYTATLPGNYTVVVTNAAGCTVTSAITTVVVNPLPAAAIVAAGPTNICAGQTVLLNANTGAGYSYQWKKGTMNITGANQSTYTAAATGIYSVVVTNTSGCSTTSPGVAVTVNAVPLAAITANGPLSFPQGGNVLLRATTGAGYTYQWKAGGTDIPGATANSLTVTNSGTYTVVVTNAAGCQATSQPVVTTVTAPRPITKSFNGDEELIKVYPNPLHRNEYLSIDRHRIPADISVQVTVSDMAGRIIHSQTLGAADKVVKIKGASGMYMVEFRWDGNNRKVFKIIKVE